MDTPVPGICPACCRAVTKLYDHNGTRTCLYCKVTALRGESPSKRVRSEPRYDEIYFQGVAWLDECDRED